MTDAQSSSSSPRPKRRRLLSRRELRRRGTSIVRVGSANLLQSTRGPYRFASTGTDNSSSEYQLSPEDPPKDEIEAFSDQSPVVAVDEITTSAEAPATPEPEPIVKANTTPRRPHKRPMQKLTHMSEKARRLRVSPESKRMRSCLLGTPPPLNFNSSLAASLPPAYSKPPPVLKLSDMTTRLVKRPSLPTMAVRE
ncbi:hypothetical protein LPJ60_005051, partial [Coemansia sp. RSA 2675]